MGVDQRLDGRALPELDGSGLTIGVVCGRFNDAITVRLLDGATRGLSDVGVADDAVVVEWVPGAFEVPFAAMAMINSGRFDAVIGLGCVIRGDTSHYDFVAGECARGLQDVGLATGVPVIFGVLTTEDRQQALDRSEGPGGHNVGEEGARTAVEMAILARSYAPDHGHDHQHDHDHDHHDHPHDHDH
jgi:6,7-dimethyl-8-ribityllumazine synthase